MGQSCGSNSLVKLVGHSGEKNLWVNFVGQNRGFKLLDHICGSNSWVKFADFLRLFGIWNWIENCLIFS